MSIGEYNGSRMHWTSFDVRLFTRHRNTSIFPIQRRLTRKGAVRASKGKEYADDYEERKKKICHVSCTFLQQTEERPFDSDTR